MLDKQIYFSQAPINMKYVYDLEKSLPSSLTAALRYSEYEPVWPADFGEKENIIEQIGKRPALFFRSTAPNPFRSSLNEAAGKLSRAFCLKSEFTAWRLLQNRT